MTLPTRDTVVTYPSGSVREIATVLHREPLPDGRVALVLDRTASHPVDAGWPDQGSDRTTLVAGGVSVPVIESIVAATDGSALHLGSDIPVRKGTEGWAFVVAHVVDEGLAADLPDELEVRIDADYRRALSRGHTACHLASLALNAELAGAWRKTPRADAAGSPDFDGTAIATSTIVENGSVDVYRVGKSVRKAGFDPTALEDAEGLAARVAARLDVWTSEATPVRIDSEGDGLTDRRFWVTAVDGTEVRIPCGGTHADSLADVRSPRVSLVREETAGAVLLTMRTSVD